MPREAAADRAAQDHEQAGEELQPGDYPASKLPNRDDDNTPTAGDPRVQWDEVVQPEPRRPVARQPADPGRPSRPRSNSASAPSHRR